MTKRSKKGQGAFALEVADDSRTVVTIGDDGYSTVFASPQAAYDHYRPLAGCDHAFWNVCYALEDFLPAEASS